MTPRKRTVARQAPDPVAEALRRQALIVEHLYDGIIVTDPAGVILEWNPAAQRMFGYSRAEALGQNVEMLNRPGEGPALTKAIKAGMRSRGQWSGELKLLAKDGTEREVEAITIALRDGHGRTIGRVAVNRDITEQRRSERIRSATFLISEAANASEHPRELFRAIHDIVGELMPAKNFYIALVDPVADTVSFPYFVDEHDTFNEPKPLGKGFTEYVLRTGQPLLATPERAQAVLGARATARFDAGPTVTFELGWKPHALDIRRLAIKDQHSNAVLGLSIRDRVLQANFSGALYGSSLAAMLKTAAEYSFFAAVPALTVLLKDGNRYIRRSAARALGSVGPEAKAAVPVLTEEIKKLKS